MEGRGREREGGEKEGRGRREEGVSDSELVGELRWDGSEDGEEGRMQKQ